MEKNLREIIMKEKNVAPNPNEKFHEDMDDDAANLITLEMEDGSEKDFVVLDILHNEGESYMALSEVGSTDYSVLRFVEVDDAFELSIIDDDDEYDTVTKLFETKFDEMLYDDEDFEELDEDEEEEEEEKDEIDEVEKELIS